MQSAVGEFGCHSMLRRQVEFSRSVGAEHRGYRIEDQSELGKPIVPAP